MLRCDRTRGRNDCRTTFVHVVELLMVLGGFALVLKLGRHGRSSGPTHGCSLSRLRPYSNSAVAAVVGDASAVVDDDGAVVDMGDVDVDAVDGPVVVEVVAIPVAAVITDPGVAEAIVDTAVEADMQSPEAPVEAVAAVVEAPIAGGPERAVIGWSAPGAWYPVVAGGSPVPVAGRPDVVGCRGHGLLINGEWRRRLIGVFDGLALTFFVELVVSLSVLISLVLRLIGGRWRSGLRGSVLFGALLRLSL